jgi:predicted transcriptional regulator of viral defense system
VHYRDTQESRRALYAVASAQGGYFTAKQAAEAGYDYPHLAYHLQARNFERAGHGLYRLPTVPASDHDDFVRLAFWSRDRDDAPQAVISHQSALFVHGLSDVLPPRIHATVPPGFRKKPPAGITLHKARLGAADIDAREGFSVTTPPRTLADAARTPDVTDEQLARAVDDALRRGMVRAAALRPLLPALPRLARVPALAS